MNKKQSGFTLIELMMVLVIFGILSSLAYSGYTAQTTKARREDAKSALVGLAQAMERQFTTTNDYGFAIGPADSVGTDAPIIYSDQSPVSGGVKHYDLRVTVRANGTYVLNAIPAAGSPQVGDGILLLESSGLRGWDRNDSGAPPLDAAGLDADELCWELTC